MEIETFYIRYWYYFLPLYVLSVVMWTMLGRFFLQFFFPDPETNYIMRFFMRLTNPVYRIAAPITPGFMPRFAIPLYYTYLLLLARIAFHGIMAVNGLSPSLEGVVQPTS